jgi:hypothetical protein
MKNLNPSKLIDKLGSVCGTLGIAIALGTSLGWSSSVEAIGFNDGSNGGITFTRNAWGPALTNNPGEDPNNTSYGNVTVVTGGASATIAGPDNGLAPPPNPADNGSYLDYYYTASVDSMLSFSGWTFQSNDIFAPTDDRAGYFIIGNAPYSQIMSPPYLNGGPITPTDNNPITSSSAFSQYLAPGDTFVFRVLSVANSTGEGQFTINDFDVQVIPFDFAPTYGVIFVGTALGINEWRKKRQASKKDETEEKL